MKASDFDGFFEAIHGSPPFPWQTRLAHEVCETNEWPSVLDLPTGAGKTSCIDVALFHWLVAASRGTPANAARRIAFVVDRRIIVDEAKTRAARISSSVAAATEGILGEARALLVERAGDPHVSVFALRGGVARERNLVRDPLRVSVVLSTVDQIGSRLLFRGYGVTDGMQSVHAGLFGTDALLLLDEAHIAEPLRQTLDGIVREQSRAAVAVSGPKPLRWAQLSATPNDASTGGRTFSLGDADREHPVLSRRLFAQKPMRLLEVAKREDLPGQLSELVKEELAAPPLSSEERARIGIVVNRVATARALHDSLRKALQKDADVELLIGRVRPLDRDEHLQELAPRLKASTRPRAGERAVVVVATQTIEVGADFDFHALFVEAASYAAIKQRVGRLNRLGIRDGARGAIVVVRSDMEEDAIYGPTIERTWALLRAHASGGVVDLGISSAPPATNDVHVEPPPTPHLSPSLLSLLVQTSPRPAVDPDVAELLHGFATQVPDISIVWREGLTTTQGDIDVDSARELLRVLPPLSLEAMSIPFSAFKQWLQNRGTKRSAKLPDSGDLEGEAPPLEAGDRERIDVTVLVVDGREARLVRADCVRPGSLVVIPAGWGGADRYGWKPEDPSSVADHSLLARDPSLRPTVASSAVGERRERRLVWTPALARAWLEPASTRGGGLDAPREDTTPAEVLSDPDATLTDARDALYAWLEANEAGLPPDVRATGRALREIRRSRVEWLEANGERVGILLREGRVAADDLVDGRALQQTVRVPLDHHLRGVGGLAETFARGVGLPESLVSALRIAGAAHDLGKADPRFQRRLGAADGELLAKSDEYDASVPRGERHEVYSVAVLDQYPDLCAEVPELRPLIRYLVGSHHGFGRATHPVTEDGGVAFDVPHGERMLSYEGKPALCSLGSGWTDLFVSMNRAYGPWTLAFLESVLRLADHRRSEQEVEEYFRSEARGT